MGCKHTTYFLSFMMVLLSLGMKTMANETLEITGTVMNAEGDAVPYAEVVLLELQNGTLTDDKGSFTLKVRDTGTYRVLAYRLGYRRMEKMIRVVGSFTEVNFRLVELSRELKEVEITSESDATFDIGRLNPVEGTAIYAAKKCEVIRLDGLAANLATNNSRQIYARVPGLNIWESDGAGLQLGIGARGLSPDRTANFNVRQNGYDISADALGYPESYYTPPLEAIRKIDIVRGAASLQYGTQFGGMVNFRFKEGPANKVIELTSRQTIGSFGYFNTFNSIGGTRKNLNYYAFFQHRSGDGWRPNSAFNSNTGFASLYWQPNPKLRIGGEYTIMHYLAQQPGGLTDALFELDPRLSIRNRNWFRVQWNLAAVKLDYRFNDRLKINSRLWGLLAGRDALGYLGRIDRADPGEERDLLMDDYLNFGNETRVIHHYDFLGNTNVLLVGIRYYEGLTHKRQGMANDLYGPDFHYINRDYQQSDYEFPSRNVALFAEHIFQFSPKLSITPGIRYEYIHTVADGYYLVRNTHPLTGEVLHTSREEEERSSGRHIVLMGAGAGYRILRNMEMYANFSQNYRAITFNNMRISIPGLVVDPNLSDERGYNADLGVRGHIDHLLNYDVSMFYLTYANKIGQIWTGEGSDHHLFRTNIGASQHIGLEFFSELNLIRLFRKKSESKLSIFTNLALIRARYTRMEEKAWEGNEVELVPDINFKTGITYKVYKFKFSLQYAYTGEQYTDATNAVMTPNAVYGTIPAYQVMDFSTTFRHQWLILEGSINNLLNASYFTRRATGYPGPGIIPSDERSFFLTLGVKL